MLYDKIKVRGKFLQFTFQLSRCGQTPNTCISKEIVTQISKDLSLGNTEYIKYVKNNFKANSIGETYYKYKMFAMLIYNYWLLINRKKLIVHQRYYMRRNTNASPAYENYSITL